VAILSEAEKVTEKYDVLVTARDRRKKRDLRVSGEYSYLLLPLRKMETGEQTASL
jgi:hypothetical protein